MPNLGKRSRGYIAALTLVATGVCWADPYIGEVEAHAGRVDANSNTNYIGGSATLYLQAVDTTGLPLAEAAFLNRATDIYAYLTFFDSDYDDGQNMGVGGEVYFPHTMFYAAASFNRTDADSGKNDSWTITGGITPAENLRLTTSYTEDAGYDPNIDAKYVLLLPGEQSLNLEAGFYDDDVNSYNAGFDFYLNNSTSAGAALSDSGSQTSYTFRGRHFFNPSFYVDAQYTTADSSDEVTVKAGLRF
ncbi:putative general porin [Alteromonadaceae bacterium 2753L.S.0a.02]|nr:putative general porin [Alteromonadaceae bacterium 2753L.S.0a.02]